MSLCVFFQLGGTALMYAAGFGMEDIVNECLTAGAVVNLQWRLRFRVRFFSGGWRRVDFNGGASALHGAAAAGGRRDLRAACNLQLVARSSQLVACHFIFFTWKLAAFHRSTRSPCSSAAARAPPRRHARARRRRPRPRRSMTRPTCRWRERRASGARGGGGCCAAVGVGAPHSLRAGCCCGSFAVVRGAAAGGGRGAAALTPWMTTPQRRHYPCDPVPADWLGACRGFWPHASRCLAIYTCRGLALRVETYG